MNRALLIATLLITPAALAQLNATASFTFEVKQLPPTGASVTGGGEVLITCSPAPYMGMTVKKGYGSIEFFYEKAPGTPSVHRVGNGFTVPLTETQLYPATALPWGVRLIPRLIDAVCVAGINAVRSNLITVDNPAFAIQPFLLEFILVTDATISTKTFAAEKIPVGTAVRIRPNVLAEPRGDEKIAVIIKGPGIDARASFADKTLAQQQGVVITATSAGPITVTTELEPYGAVSNSRTMTAVVASTGSGGGSGGTGGGAATGGSGQGPAPGGSCAAVPGLSIAAIALLLTLRRTRT